MKTDSNKIARWLIVTFFIVATLSIYLVHSQLAYSTLLAGLLSLSYGLTLIYAYRKGFTRRLRALAEASQAIIKPEEAAKLDVVAQAKLALERSVQEREQAIQFIHDIAKGELEQDEDHRVFNNSEDNLLGQALLGMQEKLKEVAKTERERVWVSEGLTLVSDLLRKHSGELTQMSTVLVSQLVKYLKANQAALFVVEDEDDATEPVLQLTACYAYDRKKYLDKKVEIGEGLLGQAYLEKDTLFITDIPQRYTRITSGLGDSTPTCLLIVPIMLNEEVLGILEIASFKVFEPYQVEFIEKMGEGVASALATTRINERTSLLLEESQLQTQELQAKEEEMRQSMEELQATQEASHRMQEELRKVEQEQRHQIEALSQAKDTMQQQEQKLLESQEKAQRRSLRFKDKMEQLDIEIEGKNARIKQLERQLAAVKDKYEISEADLVI